MHTSGIFVFRDKADEGHIRGELNSKFPAKNFPVFQKSDFLEKSDFL